MDFSDDDSDASGPTVSEVLLFLTLPASAAPLSSSLMPRHHRERILEYTKTVTRTEVVNNSTHCHPGTCEVTVTNIDSGSGHPVSVNISHLHEHTVDEGNGSGRCSPVVHVRETVKENTPTDSVEKINSCVERILRVQTEGDVTFKHRGDNVVDLSFTTPVKPVNFSELTSPDTTLYYHSFKKEITKETANDLISPDSAVSESSKRYMRSDDSDSDSGSLIIHSPVARPDSGVSSSNNRVPSGKNLSSISIGSSEDDLHYQGLSYNHKDLKNDRLPYYVVTSKAETYTSQQSPNTTTFFADLDTSGTTTTVGMNDSRETSSEVPHPHRYQKRGSRDKEKRRSILVVTSVTPSEERDSTEDITDYNGDSEWNDSLPKDKRRRITMEVLFTPPTPKENGAPPKPPRRAKYDRPQLVEHVQHYECSLDEMNEGPKMTSTPISTLERHTRSTDDTENKVTEKDKQSETPIMSPRKSSKPPALPSLQPETHQRQSLGSPRRSPSSPIIVVDQERKSSMDLLVPPKQPRRKSTITDIDWFAAFNMKEPTTPKSPRSPMVVDALREVENAVIEKRRPRSLRQERHETKPLSPAKIDLDDVFSYSQHTPENVKDEKCPCNACVLLKMSPEEALRRLNAHKKKAEEKDHTAEHHHWEVKSSHHYWEVRPEHVESDISLDDIFAPKTAAKAESHLEYYTEEPAKERDASSVHSTNMHDSIFVFPSSADTFNSHKESRSPSHDHSRTEISLEDIFESKSSVIPQDETNLDADIDHHKMTTEANYSISRSPREVVELNVAAKDRNNAEGDIARSFSAPETVFDDESAKNEDELKNSNSDKDTKEVERDSKAHEIPYVPSEINLDDIFSSTSVQKPKVDSPEQTTVQKGDDHGSPPPQRPDRRTDKERVRYTESDISLEDVFSIPSTSSYEPTEHMSTKYSSTGKESSKTQAQQGKRANKHDISGKDDVFFTPATSLSQLRPVPNIAESISDDKQLADVGYTASDISIDDVFYAKSSHSNKKPGGADKVDRSEDATPAQSILDKEDDFNPLKPQTSVSTEGSSSRIRDETGKAEKEEEKPKQPVAALQDVNWLEELLTQNHQPKEEDLKQTVIQLYEKVVPSPSNSSSDISTRLNETMESGYTSLDRTKGSASHDVSMSDSRLDLDKVFNPISPDRKHRGKANVAADRSNSPTTKDLSQESERRQNSERLTGTQSGTSLEEKRKDQLREEGGANEHVVESEEYHDYRDSKQKPDVSSESRIHEYQSVSRRHSEATVLDQTENEEDQQERSSNEGGGMTPPAEINLDDVFGQPSSSRAKQHEEKQAKHDVYKNQDHEKREATVSGKKLSKEEGTPSLSQAYNDEHQIDLPAPSRDEAYYREQIKHNGGIAEGTPAVVINLDDVFHPSKTKDGNCSSNDQEEQHVVDSEEHKTYIGPKDYVYSESRRLSHSNHLPHHDIDDNVSSNIGGEVGQEERRHKKEKGDSYWIESIVSTAVTEQSEKKEINLSDVFDKKPKERQEESNVEVHPEKGSEAEGTTEPSKSPEQNDRTSSAAVAEKDASFVGTKEGRSGSVKKENDTEVYQAAKRQEGEKHDFNTAEQLSWIEQIIDNSKEIARKRKQKKDEQNEENAEAPINVDDLLKEVFETPCASHEKGDDCNCSACKVIKMSPEELKEFTKQIKDKEKKAAYAAEHRNDASNRNDEPTHADGPIDLDDVFPPVGLEESDKKLDIEGSGGHERKTEKQQIHKHSREEHIDKPVAEQKDGDTAESSTSMDKSATVDLEEVFSPGKDKETEEEKEVKKERQWLATIVDKTEKAEEEKEQQYADDAPIEINLDDVFKSQRDSKTSEKSTKIGKEEMTSRSEAQPKKHEQSEEKKHRQEERAHSEPPSVLNAAAEGDKHSTINLDDVFTISPSGEEQRPSDDSKTVRRRPTEVGNAEKTETGKEIEYKGPARVESMDTEHRTSREAHTDQERHEDHWIQDVMSSNQQEDDEQDTFEASYLKSIKVETKKQKTAYDDYYREEIEPTRKKSVERRHLDDYYDEPEEDEEEVEDIDVADLVNDILSTSLNEAAFKVATKSGNRDTHRTDTSVDKNRRNQSSSEMYVSTTASDNRMESILSYPPSVASPVTPHSTDPGAKFISEASMTLSNSQDDDYIIRLVFANQKGEELPEQFDSQPVTETNVVTESEIATRSNSFVDFPSYHDMPQTRVSDHPAWTNQRSMSRTDEEVLEVEVNQENFIIKGNYAIVINKHDPLGVLLSELTTGSKALDFSVTPKIRRLLLQCIKEKAKPNLGKSLSSRAKDMLYSNDHAFQLYYEMNSNQYSPENTTGNINFCTAENNVCNQLVEERFRKSPDLFTPDYKHLVHYGPPGGYPEIKNKICDYLRSEISSKADVKNIVLLPSGNATYDMVCHCLFESDDVLLTNTPTYARNIINVSTRAQCELASVNFDLSDVRLDLKEYDRVYEERCDNGDNVRAVVVINPNNPLGIVFSLKDLEKLARWADEKNLWLIVDESFSQCVYDKNTTFESFLDLQMSLSTKSVCFWSLSKDFGLPGVKLSIVHTNDRDLYHALSQLELTGPVSTLAQDFVANFLADKEWLAKFKEDKLKRLYAHYTFVTENLKNLGIPYEPATAGIFLFVDFRKKLRSQTLEGEDELFKELTSRGIYMTPGSHTKSPQLGWMRLVFSCEKEQLREGFRRLYELYGSGRSIVGEINY